MLQLFPAAALPDLTNWAKGVQAYAWDPEDGDLLCLVVNAEGIPDWVPVCELLPRDSEEEYGEEEEDEEKGREGNVIPFPPGRKKKR